MTDIKPVLDTCKPSCGHPDLKDPLLMDVGLVNEVWRTEINRASWQALRGALDV